MGIGQSVANAKAYAQGNTHFRVTSVSIQNRRPGMEDTHAVILQDTAPSFVGVFDGHGGKSASHFLAKHMHEQVLALEDPYCQPALRHVAIAMDAELRRGLAEVDATTAAARGADLSGGSSSGGGGGGGDDEQRFSDNDSGSTAVFAVVRPPSEGSGGHAHATVCNVGDSVALEYRPQTHDWQFVTKDHTVVVPSEKSRVIRGGLHVADNRVNGMLAPSRAYGDFEYKSTPGLPQHLQPVTTSPDLFEVDLAPGAMLLFASDGILEDITREDLAHTLATHLTPDLSALPPEPEDAPTIEDDDRVQGIIHVMDWARKIRNSADNMEIVLLEVADGQRTRRDGFAVLPAAWDEEPTRGFRRACRTNLEKEGGLSVKKMHEVMAALEGGQSIQPIVFPSQPSPSGAEFFSSCGADSVCLSPNAGSAPAESAGGGEDAAVVMGGAEEGEESEEESEESGDHEGAGPIVIPPPRPLPYSCSPLHVAAFTNDMQGLRIAAADPAVVSGTRAKDMAGNTPLHLAVVRRNTAAVEFLLGNEQFAVWIDEANDFGWSPMREALGLGDSVMLERLLQAWSRRDHKRRRRMSDHSPTDADENDELVRIGDGGGEQGSRSPLLGQPGAPLPPGMDDCVHVAACGGFTQCLDVLLAAGVSPAERNAEGLTPLLAVLERMRKHQHNLPAPAISAAVAARAAQAGDEGEDKGVDEGVTASLTGGDPEDCPLLAVVSTLARAMRTPTTTTTAAAAAEGSAQRPHVAIEARTPEGHAALHRAAWSAHAKAVSILLEEGGADVTATTSSGATALHELANAVRTMEEMNAEDDNGMLSPGGGRMPLQMLLDIVRGDGSAAVKRDPLPGTWRVSSAMDALRAMHVAGVNPDATNVVGETYLDLVNDTPHLLEFQDADYEGRALHGERLRASGAAPE